MNIITLSILLLTAQIQIIQNIGNEQVQFPEKVYLHVDRDYYNTGEDIWFKSYVINALTNKLSLITNNLHIELISPSSVIIQSRVVRIENGLGNGDFQLSDSLPSGTYQLRAYTNFMRNFDDNFFFRKEIIVINPLDGGNELSIDPEYIENRIVINFFPEGGSLVENVSSTIAFKAVNALGKSCDITGKLFSTTGDLITEFKSTHLGMGVFNLKPTSGSEYYTLVKGLDGREFRADLPGSFPTGMTIHLFITEDKKLLLKVFTNEKTFDSVKDHELIVTLSSRNLLTELTTIRVNSLVNNYFIPLNNFPDGILRVTLSDTDGLPLCERLTYFHKNDDVKVSVSTDKNRYKPREQVTTNISISGGTPAGAGSYLSLSVAEAGLTRDSIQYPASIASWFLLESDVRGRVEDPSYYFDISNESRLKDLDLLLLTQGWRDFKWKYDSTENFRHEAGFPISGRLKRVLSKKPIAEAKINIGIFGNTSFCILTTLTDSTGKYKVEGIDFTGKAKVIVTALGDKEESAGWLFVDSSYYNPANVPVIETQKQLKLIQPDRYSELKQEAILKNATHKKYKLSDTINIGEVIIISNKPDTPQEARVKTGRSKYGMPDKELIITPSLERYVDILQAISGRIPGVLVTGSVITIRGQTPVLLRDGIPARIEDIMSIPVHMVDRVDVLNWSPLFGKSSEDGITGANGVINIITKSGGENDNTVKPLFHSTSLNMKGFDAPRIFYSPKYETPVQSAFTPDTRSTIYWEPNIFANTGKDVSLNYFNADNATAIEIKIEGITSEGIPFTGKTKYIVGDY